MRRLLCGRSCIGAPGEYAPLEAVLSSREIKQTKARLGDWQQAKPFFCKDFLFLILLAQRDTGLASRQ